METARALETAALSSLVASFLGGGGGGSHGSLVGGGGHGEVGSGLSSVVPAPAGCTGRGDHLTDRRDLATVRRLLRSGQPAARVSALSTVGRAVFLEQCARQRVNSTAAAGAASAPASTASAAAAAAPAAAAAALPSSRSVACILAAGLLPLVCDCLPVRAIRKASAAGVAVSDVPTVTIPSVGTHDRLGSCFALDGDGAADLSGHSMLTSTDRRSEMQRLAVVALAIMSRQSGRPLRGCFSLPQDQTSTTTARSATSAATGWQARAIAALTTITSGTGDVSTARQAAEVLLNTAL